MKHPLFIACGDIHLMEKRPVCRTEATDEEFHEVMWSKVGALRQKAYELQVPVLYAGDTFDTWECDYWLVREAMGRLPQGYAVAGQHELPYHSIKQIHRSPLSLLYQSVGVLDAPVRTGKYTLYGASWGEEPCEDPTSDNGPTVLLWHNTVWQEGAPPYPGAPDKGKVGQIMRRYPYDIFVCGDNHKPFIHQEDGRLFINCGSMLRSAADQVDYIPQFHVVYDDLSVESIPYTNALHPISREHLDVKKEKEATVFAFLESLKDRARFESLDFRHRLRTLLESADEPAIVQDTVWRLVENTDE